MSADATVIPFRPRPRRADKVASNGVMGMILFIFVEVMLFAGFISAFVIVKARAPGSVWPPPGQPRLPFERTAVNTTALIASGVVLLLAHRAYQRGKTAISGWLALATALGAAFVALQGAEWAALLQEGLTLTSSTYGSLFYTIIGAHAPARRGRDLRAGLDVDAPATRPVAQGGALRRGAVLVFRRAGLALLVLPGVSVGDERRARAVRSGRGRGEGQHGRAEWAARARPMPAWAPSTKSGRRPANWRTCLRRGIWIRRGSWAVGNARVAGRVPRRSRGLSRVLRPRRRGANCVLGDDGIADVAALGHGRRSAGLASQASPEGGGSGRLTPRTRQAGVAGQGRASASEGVFQSGEEGRIPFGHGSGPAEVDGSLPVDEDRGREAAGPERVLRSRVRIQDDVVFHAHFGDEVRHGVQVGAPVHGHAQDAQAVVAVTVVQLLQIGRLFSARVAPRGPEIDEQREAAVVSEGNCAAAAQGFRAEARGRIAAAKGKGVGFCATGRDGDGGRNDARQATRSPDPRTARDHDGFTNSVVKHPRAANMDYRFALGPDAPRLAPPVVSSIQSAMISIDSTDHVSSMVAYSLGAPVSACWNRWL